MEFIPHVALIAADDTVTFQNHDKVDHNVMSHDAGYDLGTWARATTVNTCSRPKACLPEPASLTRRCWPTCFVGQSRFAAVVDDKSKFSIDGVPDGAHELAVWNPRLKATSQKVTVAAGGATVKFPLAR